MKANSYDKLYVTDKVSVVIPDNIIKKIEVSLTGHNFDIFVFFRYLIGCMNLYCDAENHYVVYIDEAGRCNQLSVEVDAKKSILDFFLCEYTEKTVYVEIDNDSLQILYGFEQMQSFLEYYYDKKINGFLNFSREGSGIVLEMIYDIGFFNGEEAQNFLDLYVAMVSNVISNPKICLDKLCFYNDYYDTYQQYEPEEQSIIDVFKDVVSCYPQKNALIDRFSSYSYQELDAVSDHLAVYLKRTYNFDNKRIAIYMDRSADFVICILAILKMGFAYIPINTKFPEERVNYILNSCNPDLVISRGFDIELPKHKKYDYRSSDFLFEDTSFDSECCYKDIAYIIYTSGTTGTPKGAMISHYNVANMNYHFKEDLQVRSDDIVGQYASFAFDASVSETFMALFTGASLYVIDDETISNFSAFEDCIRENKVSVITLPPGYSRYVDFSGLHTLRLLLTAGSECNIDLFRTMSRYFQVINAYGPTECTVCATTWHGSKDSYIYHNVPIGVAIPKVRVYIVNRFGVLLPPFMIGEICIGGNSVGMGYLGNSQLTDEKYVEDILFPNEKMYRTGDYGRMLPDGSIEFLGRRDDQVKVNGIRVELSEINEKVLSIQGIINAFTMIEKKEKEKICLYYVAENEYITPSKVREILNEKLPLSMVPNHIHRVEELVLNTSGKVDKSKLGNVIEYENTLERQNKYGFEAIFETVLDDTNICIDRNLFENGGSSIDVIRIITDIEHKYGIQLSITDFFTSSSLGELYELIQSSINKECV